MREAYQNLAPSTPFQKERLSEDLLDCVHFSWLAPYLRTHSTHDLPFLLAALNPAQKEGLEKLLGYRNGVPPLEPIAKRHLRTHLRSVATQNQSLIPLSCLPESPLNPLAELEEKRLLKLIRFLGLHDLSLEMRQIIATATLKKIFHSLAKDEGEYLNSLLLHREPLVFKRLFLEKWDGTKENLENLLEERGLQRLAHALQFASPSLSWYITHRLDIQLASTLLSYTEKPSHTRAESLLTGQIEKILPLLQNGGGS